MRWAPLMAGVLLTACSSSGRHPEMWSFPCSRTAYAEPSVTVSDDMSRWTALFLDTLPLAIDLALLPVTGVHDIWVACRR